MISCSSQSSKPVDASWEAWRTFVKSEYQKSRIISLCSLFISKYQDPRPYLRVSMYGIALTGLLDSGCTRTCIGRLGWQKLRGLNLTVDPFPYSVSLANGIPCDVLGVVNIPIDLEGKVRLIRCLVVLDLKDEIVLGMDFWIDMDIMAHFSKMSWEFREGVVASMAIENRSSGSLSREQKLKLDAIVAFYLNKMGSGLGCATGVSHVIDTGDSLPIKQRYYRVSPYIEKAIHQEIDRMLSLGVIEPSNSAWSSPVVMVQKSSGDYRFCVDFRQVNKVTRRDAYPLPYVSSILDRLRNARFISSIDLKSAYWQVPLEEQSKEKTAFTVPGRGLYQFTRMPFGLHNAPATWQRFVDKVLGSLDGSVFVYLDDIIIVTPDFESHVKVIGEVLDKLHKAGLTVNAEKCEFGKKELRYLGYLVTKEGLHTDPSKVECIVNYPAPRNVREVRRFLGMLGWYRNFIKNFASRVSPLTKLTHKNHKFVWTPVCEASFQDVKQCLISSPILACPDFSEEFILQADASQIGLGCVLCQKFQDGEKVISYASRTLTPQESKYSTTELECLAVLWGIEKFRAYIEGTKFTVITDHASLLWLHRLKNPSGRLARWALRMQGYNFSILHRKGKSHNVPDALSRAFVSYIDVTPENCDNWYRELRSSIRSCPQKYPKFKIRDDKIYKFVNYGHPTYDHNTDWKLVLPKSLRRDALKENHDEPHSGHLGYFKTKKRISSLYYWPGLSADVLRYIRNCEVCKSQKPEQKLPHGVMAPRIVSRPWEVVSSDIIGPLPMSYKRNRYILVVCDIFTKYCLLFPLKKATSQAVVSHLEEDVFMIYGVPERLICDNGKQYVSHAFRKMCASYDCSIVFNAQYSPSANPTERVNRVIKTMIRSYITQDQRKWDENLPKIGFGLRTAIHEVTGFSPAYLNFGRQPFISGKLHKVEVTESNELTFNSRDELASHVRDVQELCSDVKRKLDKAYDSSASRYNLRKRPLSLEVGQIVWKRHKTLSDAADFFASKLAPKFIKCQVVKKVSTNVYELADFQSGRSLGTWHIRDIKTETEN